MNALKADAKSVDIRALCVNFYALGARILELFEEEEVCDVLMMAWRARAAEVADHARNAARGGAAGGGGVGRDVEFLRGLDEGERGLFKVQHEAAKAMRDWMEGGKKG